MQFENFYQKVSKPYVQFDFPLGRNRAKKYFNDVQKTGQVIHHRFLPFISISITFEKHPTPEKPRNVKSRPISLVSHSDAGIYTYYAEMLNDRYNAYVVNHGIDDVAVAYRTGGSQHHGSNITAAHEVFDFIDASEEGWVLKGDFKGFFDHLNHKVLWRRFLNVIGELSNDEKLAWTKVFDELTRFRTIKKATLIKRLKKSRRFVTVKKNDKVAYFDNLKTLGDFLKENQDIINRNRTNEGIPQGTGLSAVMANVYMTEFDEKAKNMVYALGGIYRRYSDDFVVVLPKTVSELQFETLTDEMLKMSQDLVELEIEHDKTKALSFKHGEFFDLKKDNQSAGLDYLGFLFANNTVSIRGGSSYKYYYRGRKALKSANTAKKIFEIASADSSLAVDDIYKQLIKGNQSGGAATALKNKIQRILFHVKRGTGLPEIHNSYRRYVIDPEFSKPRTSFISYAIRAEEEFSKGSHSYRVVINKQLNKQRARLAIKYLHET